jgi:hypothetical protein
MQMMDDEQPHTIKNTLNKYTIKGMELRKELVSTIMEMMFPKYSNWVTIKWTKESAESIIRKYPFSAKSFFLLVCFARQAVFFLLYLLFFGQQHF